MDKTKLVLVVSLIGTIIIRPEINIANINPILKLVLLILLFYISWLIIIKYDETVGYLFIVAFTLFLTNKNKDYFVTVAGKKNYDMEALEKVEEPEKDLEFDEVPYHKYLHEKSEISKTKDEYETLESYEQE